MLPPCPPCCMPLSPVDLPCQTKKKAIIKLRRGHSSAAQNSRGGNSSSGISVLPLAREGGDSPPRCVRGGEMSATGSDDGRRKIRQGHSGVAQSSCGGNGSSGISALPLAGDGGDSTRRCIGKGNPNATWSDDGRWHSSAARSCCGGNTFPGVSALSLTRDGGDSTPGCVGGEGPIATRSDGNRPIARGVGVAPRVKLKLDSRGIAPRCVGAEDTSEAWSDKSRDKEPGVVVPPRVKLNLDSRGLAPRVKLSLASLFAPQDGCGELKGGVEKGEGGVGDDSAPELPDSASVATC